MVEEQSANRNLLSGIESLVNAWCDRRCLVALKFILQGWPLSSGLTDDWGQLLDSLQNVRSFAAHELTADEAEKLTAFTHEVHRIVYRR